MVDAKKHDVNLGRLRDSFKYEPETGALYKKRRDGSYSECGVLTGKYLRVSIDRKRYLCHRLIWILVYGEWPENCIDHIDGNGTNNRIDNLRDVTYAVNQRNTSMKKTNTSGHVGVYYRKDKASWLASIKMNGKTIPLGLFKNKINAIQARKLGEAIYGFHTNHGRRQA